MSNSGVLRAITVPAIPWIRLSLSGWCRHPLMATVRPIASMISSAAPRAIRRRRFQALSMARFILVPQQGRSAVTGPRIDVFYDPELPATHRHAREQLEMLREDIPARLVAAARQVREAVELLRAHGLAVELDVPPEDSGAARGQPGAVIFAVQWKRSTVASQWRLHIVQGGPGNRTSIGSAAGQTEIRQ